MNPGNDNGSLSEKEVQLKDSGNNNFGSSYTAWNVSSCSNFSNMFAGASKFNNGIQNDIADQNNLLLTSKKEIHEPDLTSHIDKV